MIAFAAHDRIKSEADADRTPVILDELLVNGLSFV
jgi:hypothetical protein